MLNNSQIITKDGNIIKNDGKVYTGFYDSSPSELTEIANIFSEGNPKLAAALLEMWKKGIRTNSCCNLAPNNTWFILFEVDRNSENLIKTLLSSREEFADLDISFRRRDDNTVQVNVGSLANNRDQLLDRIVNTLGQDKTPEVGYEAERDWNNVVKLNEISKNEGICFKYGVKGRNTNLCFSKYSFSLYYYDDNIINLFETVKNENVVPFGGYEVLPSSYLQRFFHYYDLCKAEGKKISFGTPEQLKAAEETKLRIMQFEAENKMTATEEPENSGRSR